MVSFFVVFVALKSEGGVSGFDLSLLKVEKLLRITTVNFLCCKIPFNVEMIFLLTR